MAETLKPATSEVREAVREHILDMFKPQPAQGFMELHARALTQVQASPLWKYFIEGTPLENDIAVWMANFAIEAIQERK